MVDSTHSRFAAAHLDDLAIVILTTPPGTPATLRPELDEIGRARLRSRLKLIGRHDWPSNLCEDPALRHGYTLRQCFRLMTALLLLDAHIPPSIAIQMARANELQFLRTITAHLMKPPTSRDDDPVAVVLLGQFWESLDPLTCDETELYRIRVMTKAELPTMWSRELAVAGQRLPVDVGGAAKSMWGWIRSRNLLPADALSALTKQLELSVFAPGYQPTPGVSKRR